MFRSIVRFLVACLPWMSVLYLHAQQPFVDSLDKVLRGDLRDSARLKNMVFRAMYLEPVDPGKAHVAYAEARKAAMEKHNRYYEAMAWRYEATLYGITNERAAQKHNLEMAIGLLQGADDHLSRSELGMAQGDLGSHFRSNGQPDSAIICFRKNIATLEQIGNNRTAIPYVNLSMVYHDLALRDLERDALDHALVAAGKQGSEYVLFQVWSLYAQNHIPAKHYDSAMICLDSAHVHLGSDIDFLGVYTYHLLKAVTHQNLGNNDSALTYYAKTLALAKVNHSSINMLEPLLQLGFMNYERKRYDTAEALLKEALAGARQDSSLIHQKEAWEDLGLVYKATGRWESAYRAMDSFRILKDTLAGIDRVHFADELERKYGTARKDAEIHAQEARHRLDLVLLGTLLFALVALALFFLMYRKGGQRKRELQERRISELEKEKKLDATEAVLRGEEQERRRLAKDLHDGLSGMLSGIKYNLQDMKENMVMTSDIQASFARSLDMLDSSIQEMRRVAQNMMPETLYRFGLDRALRDHCADVIRAGIVHVSYQSMGMDGIDLTPSRALHLYRIVQELVNNVIKHAGATELFVQCMAGEGRLIVNVEDNGKGFDPAAASNGMGWNNIRSRMEYLQGKADIRSAPGQGSSINIEMPLDA